ncbi:MAG: hypothetical protein ABIG64_01945 [Candidatus Omnitrophota bacterium]
MLRSNISAFFHIQGVTSSFTGAIFYSAAYRQKIHYTEIQSKKKDALLVFWGGVSRQKKENNYLWKS